MGYIVGAVLLGVGFCIVAEIVYTIDLERERKRLEKRVEESRKRLEERGEEI